MTETENTSRRPGALIAMSGGVDSSVAAWLMQRDGFDCTGITMRLTRNEAVDTEGLHTCCSERDIEDAAEVAYAMDIPYEVLDFTADFQEKIIDKFIRVYEAGGTPNPCIDCNKYMKFDHLLRWAEAHGLDYVVTGHYARVEQDEATGRWLLKKGLDEGKDQSYVLYNLTQEQLAHVRLPLGGLHKSEVRAIAEEQGLRQRPQARQSGHLLRARWRLRPLYGGLHRQTLSGGRFPRRQRQKGGHPQRRGAVHHRPAEGAGPCHGRAGLRLRQGYAGQHRHRRPGGGAVRYHRLRRTR